MVTLSDTETKRPAEDGNGRRRKKETFSDIRIRYANARWKPASICMLEIDKIFLAIMIIDENPSPAAFSIL